MTPSFWRDRHVFVTGATGFLGSWLTQALVDDGARVTILYRDIVPQSLLAHSGYLEKVTIVRGALEDYPTIERALGEYEIDTVFHVGAQAIVEIANRNPLSTFETNIKGTWNVLEACRRTPTIKRIIVASSDKAYGIHETLPYDEAAPLQGRFPYDVSKTAADLIAQSYYHTYKLPVAITRCGNFFGGGDLNFNRIVPSAIRSLLYNEPPVIRSNGKFRRDYLYIEDAARAYLTLAEKMNDAAIHGHAFNFSTESPKTVLEMVDAVIVVMKSAQQPTILNTATHEIPDQYLSATKAKGLLNWRPRFSFEEAQKITVAWDKTFFSL